MTPPPGGWRFVTWGWATWHGKDRDYSLPHVVDAERSDQNQLTTYCGLLVGPILTETTGYELPEKVCSKCRAAWRKRP